MSSEWPEVKLGDVADLLTGYPFKSQHYTDDRSAPRLIGGDNIVQGSLRWENVRRWPRTLTAGLDDYWLQQGDVVLAMDRPWIEAGLKRAAISKDDLPSLLIQRTARLRGTKDLETDFLRYVISSSAFTQYVLSVQTGTAVPHISPTQIRAYSFQLPPIEEQHAIASILGALDDKIELNRRMNATLEALAQAVFKEWFVEKPEEAWEEVPFARTVKVFAGGTPKTSIKEYWNGDIPWFAIADAGPTDVFVVDTERKVTQAGIDNSSAQIVPKGTTIFTARGTVGQTVLTGVPMAMNQSCFGLWGVHDRYGYYTYFRARQLAEQFQQYSHGSVFSTINRSTFETLETRLPDKDTIARFEDFVKPMMERILVNISESRNLAALRDTLLPKLMRGEVRVREAATIKALPTP